MKRICKQCGKELPLSEFYMHNKYYDTKCKQCCRTYSKEYAEKNADKIKQYRKKRQAERQEKKISELNCYISNNNLVQVPDFPSYYVDRDGNVYSTKKQGGYRCEPYKMTPVEDKYGYLKLNFYKNGKRYNQSVHRVIAKTFIENPNNLPQVNHIDGNKLNNNVDNLEWCSISDNLKHSFMCLNRKNKGNPKPILVEDTTTNEKFIFESSVSCAKFLDLSRDYLVSILSGKYDKKFVEERLGCKISYFDFMTRKKATNGQIK